MDRAVSDNVIDIKCRKMYYDTARDILGLFRAIAPLVKAQDIKQIPRVAMLFYNDCMLISHHLLTLGNRYTAKLPNELRVCSYLQDGNFWKLKFLIMDDLTF